MPDSNGRNVPQEKPNRYTVCWSEGRQMFIRRIESRQVRQTVDGTRKHRARRTEHLGTVNPQETDIDNERPYKIEMWRNPTLTAVSLTKIYKAIHWNRRDVTNSPVSGTSRERELIRYPHILFQPHVLWIHGIGSWEKFPEKSLSPSRVNSLILAIDGKHL